MQQSAGWVKILLQNNIQILSFLDPPSQNYYGYSISEPQIRTKVAFDLSAGHIECLWYISLMFTMNLMCCFWHKIKITFCAAAPKIVVRVNSNKPFQIFHCVWIVALRGAPRAPALVYQPLHDRGGDGGRPPVDVAGVSHPPQFSMIHGGHWRIHNKDCATFCSSRLRNTENSAVFVCYGTPFKVYLT